MAGASIETTLELWASLLRDVRRGYVPYSGRSGLQYRLGSFWTDFLGTS